MFTKKLHQKEGIEYRVKNCPEMTIISRIRFEYFGRDRYLFILYGLRANLRYMLENYSEGFK